MTAAHTDETLTLPDGRMLGYAEYGAPDGEPGFYFHGHPGSRFEAALAHEAALASGLRIIAVDRPGYGRSDFQRGRTILDWPADVAAAADALSIGTFSVLGAYGGGPYSLACASLLPERVVRVGVVSGVGPYSAPGVTDGMRLQNRIAFKWGARIPPLARFIMSSMARQTKKNPERTVEAVAAAMSGRDAEIAKRPEVQQALIAVITEAFRQGSEGSAWDMILLGRPWGFRLEDIKMRVHLWQGEEDVLVPPAMGRYMADHIPDCVARFFPGEGHLLVVDHMEEILGSFVAP